MDGGFETRRDGQSHIDELRGRTPFYPRLDALSHQNDWYSWAGWRAPNSLWDEELEYFALRSQTSLFDISPMVKYRIEGPDAVAYLDRLMLRNVAKLGVNRVHYTAWCDDQGQVLDDGTLFRLSEARFRLCCQERHLPWLLDSALGFEVHVSEETERIAGLALQGPTSFAVLQEAGFTDVEKLKPFQIGTFPLGRSSVTISRTGFTGDLGYELFVDNEHALALWDLLFEAGQKYGIRAIGYSALNRARIEAGFIVSNVDFITSGHVIRADRTRQPDEIGLGWLVDMEKGHFNGKAAIVRARKTGSLRYHLVGLEIEGNIPAEHAIIYHAKKREVGLVTSAIWSPTAKRNIAIASIERPYGLGEKSDLWVEIYAMRELSYHKMMKRARIVKKPFIQLPRRGLTPPGLN